ncbi:MAG: enoyl-CoA hydratase/isomerase family protein [Chloroflexi bacterium]|nr:enoyl-CoA hydratase/isomerase family protein [Chloroflexota bacterium]
MRYETIKVSQAKGVANVTLNRPDRRNAYNMQMLYDLVSALGQLSVDDKVRVVVLTGAGVAFCSGADFRYRELKSGKVKLEEAEELRPVIDGIHRGKPLSEVTDILMALHYMPKPTIASVNGDAVGAGFDFALACNMRIGSPKARFMVGFTRIGLPPDTGTAWFLPKIVGPAKAMEIIMTADFVSGEEAHRLGILNRLAPAAKLEAETKEFAARIAEGPPIAHRITKMLIDNGERQDIRAALTEAMGFVHMGISSRDHQEGVSAFAEKRKPVFKDK